MLTLSSLHVFTKICPKSVTEDDVGMLTLSSLHVFAENCSRIAAEDDVGVPTSSSLQRVSGITTRNGGNSLYFRFARCVWR